MTALLRRLAPLAAAIAFMAIAPAAPAAAATFDCDVAFLDASVDAATYNGIVFFKHEKCVPPRGMQAEKLFISYTYADDDGVPMTAHLYPLCTKVHANESGRHRTRQWTWDGSGSVCGQ